MCVSPLRFLSPLLGVRSPARPGAKPWAQRGCFGPIDAEQSGAIVYRAG